MTSAQTPADTGRGIPPELRRIFAGLILSMILAALDQSIVNTALPRMASDLGGLAHLSWVVTAFMLASTSATPIWGKMSDMYGRRPFLMGAVLLFLVMSMLCGLAQSMPQLIASRLLQGIGAGGIMTLTQTVISDVVSPRERVRYQGLFAGAFAFSSLAGPLLGGGLTTALSWRWVFYINLPVGLIALALLWKALPPAPTKQAHKIDYAGAGLLVVAASSLMLLFSLGGSLFAWGSPVSYGLAALAMLSFVVFVQVERRAAEPIVSLPLFTIAPFTTGVLTMSCMSFAMMSAMVFLPLYFQLVLGLNPAEAGAMMLPQVVAMVLTSVFGGRLSSKVGRPKVFMATGIAFEALGLISLALLSKFEASIPYFWGSLLILGFGMGIAMPNAVAIVQSSVPRESVGTATASMSFLRSLGGALGVAVSGGVMAMGLKSGLSHLNTSIDVTAIVNGGMDAVEALPATLRPAIEEAFRSAITGSFEIGGGVMALAFLVALVLRGPDWHHSAAHSNPAE
ncbi:MFS transporter [Donghicola sp. C2-DW-16]|uniref:MFS transporter n=1 Tax=Donghicola mangrovi TaxID=2729614 RepID=A0ABX2PHH0_9RHOB|nr:MDR family MFS transporter [Donghicola mangrovi]NVO28947.1 MFS transporter [Donghicola mangrovi]